MVMMTVQAGGVSVDLCNPEGSATWMVFLVSCNPCSSSPERLLISHSGHCAASPCIRAGRACGAQRTVGRSKDELQMGPASAPLSFSLPLCNT